MWTITDEQISNIETASGEAAVMPCKKVEVNNLLVGTPVPTSKREIISSKWLSNKNVLVKSTNPDRSVKINLKTKGIPDGDKLKIKIINQKDTVHKGLELIVNGNKAESDIFQIKKEWLGDILFIKSGNNVAEHIETKKFWGGKDIESDDAIYKIKTIKAMF